MLQFIVNAFLLSKQVIAWIITLMVYEISIDKQLLSLSTVVFNSRDRQGMYGMQHFRVPRNPPYKRI